MEVAIKIALKLLQPISDFAIYVQFLTLNCIFCIISLCNKCLSLKFDIFDNIADISTPGEEAIMIMDRVHSFLLLDDVEDRVLPWETLQTSDCCLKAKEAKLDAIQEYLGMFLDGTPVPLTLRQRIFFGSPVAKLEYKITKVRLAAKGIIRDINSCRPWEADIKDTRLIRMFVLECLSPFKRYALEVNNLSYDERTRKKSSWFTYAASWCFISGCLCFYLYWIFAWGVYSGNDTIASWGAVYGTSAGNDIFLIQITKIYVLCILPIQAMQTQLVNIRKVLADVSLNYINRASRDGDARIQEDANDVRVVQHTSAACTASRSPELRDLPSAWLLRQVKSLLSFVYYFISSTFIMSNCSFNIATSDNFFLFLIS